ncbi:MAG: AMIN domain-containing protein [Goleter apudmare HA4340-LM2]|jgi:hypothetical protein|nr:AMIN domain-containing protein [Goleter apudmare HA4340-LM2]
MNKKLEPRQFFQMSKQSFSISMLSLYTVIVLEPGSSVAKPLPNKSPIPNRPTSQSQNINAMGAPIARLDDWRFYPEATQLEFSLSASATPRYFYLAQPPRIVVDLPNTKLGYVPTQQTYSGAIQRIRVSQLNASVTRIVLDLAPGNSFDPNQLQLQPFPIQNPTRWVLRPLIRGYGNSLQPGNYPQTPNHLPINPHNNPQTQIILPPSSYNYPQLPNGIPPTNTNQQQPFVTVPPLTSNIPSQQSSPLLPPPSFPNQPSNFNNLPPIASPNFPVPLVPNYPSNVPITGVIEFGQPLPKARY